MSDADGDVFRGLRARLRELEEDKAQLERKLALAEVEHGRMSAWLRFVMRSGRGRLRQAALDALFSLRWPKGVKPHAAKPPASPDEDSQS